MRLRHPVVAATALGLAGAVLPAGGAAAEQPDRHHEVREDVTYEGPNGSSVFCTVIARLDWTFNQDGPQDDVLSASTQVLTSYSEPDAGACEFSQSSVTLRWTDHYYRGSQRKTYSSEGGVSAGVGVLATPYSQETFTGAGAVSSEHHVVLGNCYADCDWSHSFAPK